MTLAVVDVLLAAVIRIGVIRIGTLALDLCLVERTPHTARRSLWKALNGRLCVAGSAGDDKYL